MLVFMITCGAMFLMITLIGIRIILLPNGEFHGTCSTNNEFLRKEGSSCPVCGNNPKELCPSQKK